MDCPAEFVEFAKLLARESGELIRPYFGRPDLRVEAKEDASPVTEADRRAEELMRTMIGDRYPEHGIIGEEFGQSNSDAQYCWIIDPIDGTKSFVSGVPLYSTLLALTDGDEALVGVAHFAALDDTLYALRRGGCYWNGRRAHVSTRQKLADAVLLTSELNYFHLTNRRQAWQHLVESTYEQRT